MLTLYYAKGTAALAPHILLEEAGAEYETRELSFAAQEQGSAGYLAVNPRGRVPALETPQGTLTEVPAILPYIAQTHPGGGFLPEDPFAQARSNEFNSYCASTVHVAHAHKMRGARWADGAEVHAAMQARVAGNMTDCAEMIEAHFLRGPWVLGERFSICDPYLLVMVRWMRVDGVDMSRFARLEAHFEAMRARPAVARVLALHE